MLPLLVLGCTDPCWVGTQMRIQLRSRVEPMYLHNHEMHVEGVVEACPWRHSATCSGLFFLTHYSCVGFPRVGAQMLGSVTYINGILG
jgi:hypothetical protein